MMKTNSKVRIKSKKWYDSLKDGSGMISGNKIPLGFNNSMSSFCGKVATIVGAGKIYWDGKTLTYYRIDLDQSRWKWADDMFDTTHKGIEIE